MHVIYLLADVLCSDTSFLFIQRLAATVANPTWNTIPATVASTISRMTFLLIFSGV